MKPDFSGQYILDRDASALSAAASAMTTAVLRIEHDDPRFYCAAKFSSDGGRRLRATERMRGGGRDQDNVWEFARQG